MFAMCALSHIFTFRSRCKAILVVTLQIAFQVALQPARFEVAGCNATCGPVLLDFRATCVKTRHDGLQVAMQPAFFGCRLQRNLRCNLGGWRLSKVMQCGGLPQNSHVHMHTGLLQGVSHHLARPRSNHLCHVFVF